MEEKHLDPSIMVQDADWVGTNAAFTCPKCSQVFLVNAQLHRYGRECPACGGSKGYVDGAKVKNGSARLEWSISN